MRYPVPCITVRQNKNPGGIVKVVLAFVVGLLTGAVLGVVGFIISMIKLDVRQGEGQRSERLPGENGKVSD
jgi:hypothetical protein